MGSLFDKLWKNVAPVTDEKRVLLLGFDNAGKTTIFNYLKNGYVSAAMEHPTIGFNVDAIGPINGLTLVIWDITGLAKIRKMWSDYCKTADGLLFVVDSADRDQLEEVRDELHYLLEQKIAKDVPCVVMANKQDVSKAMSADEVAVSLDLKRLSLTRPCHIYPTCALRGTGVDEAISKLAQCIKQEKYSKTA